MSYPELDSIHKRGRVLEEAFFAERDRELLESLRRKMTSEEAKQVLASATGVVDEIEIPELKGLSLPQFLAVLGIFPLVEVAWCDRHISAEERQAILAAAAELGVVVDSPSYRLLDRWLESRPSDDAISLWTDYVRAVCATLEPKTIATLKKSVMGRAQQIAQAAGGIFGMGNKISPEERACLERLALAFQPTDETH